MTVSVQSILDEVKERMSQALGHLAEDLKNIRTGRASPSLLDSVMVDAYGTQMRLRDTANITAPEPRQLLVTPFDQNNVGLVGKGIEKANLGVQPVIDGNVIRITIPEMDEAKRKEMVKIAWDRCEKTKVAVREARRKGNEQLKLAKSDGHLTEDEQKSGEKRVQELTDDFCKKADSATETKEKEVLAI